MRRIFRWVEQCGVVQGRSGQSRSTTVEDQPCLTLPLALHPAEARRRAVDRSSTSSSIVAAALPPDGGKPDGCPDSRTTEKAIRRFIDKLGRPGRLVGLL